MRQSDEQYLDSLRKRYAQARKKERGQILNEYVQTTPRPLTLRLNPVASRGLSRPSDFGNFLS